MKSNHTQSDPVKTYLNLKRLISKNDRKGLSLLGYNTDLQIESLLRSDKKREGKDG